MNPTIELYPNPAFKTLMIKDARDCSFAMYDLQGRCVKSEILTDIRQRIDLSGLVAGVYVVTIAGRHGSLTQKIVVNDNH